MYLIIALVVGAFAAGYGSAWQLENKQIAILEAKIELSNQEAVRLTGEATTKINAAKSEAALIAIQLESDHVKATQSTSALRTALDVVRLRDPGQRQRCPDPVSKGANTREPETAPDPGQLSAESSKFLRDQAWQADTVANFANECYRFMINNCGISP